MDKKTIISFLCIIVIIGLFSIYYWKVEIGEVYVFLITFSCVIAGIIFFVYQFISEGSASDKKKKQSSSDGMHSVLENLKKTWLKEKGEKLQCLTGASKFKVVNIPTEDGKVSKLYAFCIVRVSGDYKKLPIVFVVNNSGEILYVNENPTSQEFDDPLSGYSPYITGAPVPKPDLAYEPTYSRTRREETRRGKKPRREEAEDEESEEDNFFDYVGVSDDFI